MLNAEEMVFVVDENNNPLKPELRSIAHKNGLWHRTTGIWVLNKRKQILCQKRSMNKDVKPGYWEAFFGGHVGPQEEYLDSAVSEVQEELGISIAKTDLIPYKVLKSDKPSHREFQHVFALFLQDDQNTFQFEKDEIDELMWKELEEVRDILVKQKKENWVKKPWDEEVLTWLSSL